MSASRTDQEGKELGVDRQREDCLPECDRRGWKVHRVYTDNDRGASRHSTKARPEWDALLSDLRSGTIDGIVFATQSRLTRTELEFHQFLTEFDALEKAGRSLVLLEARGGEYDLSTPDGRFMASLKSALDAKESEEISARTRRAKRQQAESGAPARRNGVRPFGFADDFETHNEAEAEMIRDAAARIIGGVPVRTICREWNEAGVRTPRGNEWAPINIKKVITAPRVAGLRQHQGEPAFDATWEPIISRETWDVLCRVIEQKAARYDAMPASRNLLTGFLTCDVCGTKLKSGRKYRTNPDGSRRSHHVYKCIKQAGSSKACGTVLIGGPAVDTILTDAVIERVVATAAIRSEAEKRSKSRGADRVESLSVQLTEKRAKLEALEADRYLGDVTEASYKRIRPALVAQIEELERERDAQVSAPLMADVPVDEDALRSAWAPKGIDWQRAVIASVLRDVRVRPSTKRGAHQDYHARLAPPAWVDAQ